MKYKTQNIYSDVQLFFLICRVGAQLGLNHMLSVEIKVPNRLVGLGKYQHSIQLDLSLSLSLSLSPLSKVNRIPSRKMKNHILCHTRGGILN